MWRAQDSVNFHSNTELVFSNSFYSSSLHLPLLTPFWAPSKEQQPSLMRAETSQRPTSRLVIHLQLVPCLKSQLTYSLKGFPTFWAQGCKWNLFPARDNIFLSSKILSLSPHKKIENLFPTDPLQLFPMEIRNFCSRSQTPLTQWDSNLPLPDRGC